MVCRSPSNTADEPRRRRPRKAISTACTYATVRQIKTSWFLDTDSKISMQYSKFQIYIHRPYISKHGIQPYPPVGPGHIHARNTAIEHAVRISRLLCKYKSLYSLQYINIEAISITFSAALILVFATVSEFDGPTDADLRLHLSQCCKALAELGKTFQSSTRTLDVLLSIKRVWQAKLLASAGSKRANSTMRSTSDKRPRLISTEQTSS